MMIRDLPRGPFSAFLHTNYFYDKQDFLPRFSMGQGAIFSIQRVMPFEHSLIAPGLISETDPLMLEEMASLISALSLDVVSLAEMRRRLQQNDLKRRFVCFTFDGAYRSVLEKVLPLFKAHLMPFTVYVSPDSLEKSVMPWWLSLETLLARANRVVMDINGERVDVQSASTMEKRNGYSVLLKHLLPLPREERIGMIDRGFRSCGINKDNAIAEEMLTADELKQLAQSSLVTIGCQASGDSPLSELSFDQAQASMKNGRKTIEAATGQPPRHFVFSSTEYEVAPAREIQTIQELGFETAVGNVEGALWPEHRHEMHHLPRIALNNDPATLVRALMLGADRTPISSSDDVPMRRSA